MVRRALALHLALLATLALLPLGAGGGPWVAAMPFVTITAALARGLTAGTIVSVAGNVVVFVPVGVLAPAAFTRCRSWACVLGLGLVVSLALETAQLAVSLAVGRPYRQADVDDLILNVAGTAAGFVLWRLAVSQVHRRAVQRCGDGTFPPPSDASVQPEAVPAHRPTAQRPS